MQAPNTSNIPRTHTLVFMFQPSIRSKRQRQPAIAGQLHGSVGQYVRDLELIAKATCPEDWWRQIEQLPLR